MDLFNELSTFLNVVINLAEHFKIEVCYDY